MSRQPLSKVIRLEDNIGYSLGQGPHLFDSAKECTRLIGCCLASWGDVQVQLATLLSVLLKSYNTGSFAVFLALKTSRSRREVLQAAANATLGPREIELFNAIMIVLGAIEKERNDLAHGIFAYYPILPDCILWVDPNDGALHQVNSIRQSENNTRVPTHHEDIKTKMFVYRPRDIAEVYESILSIRTTILSFFKFVRMNAPDDRYHRLCSEPLIHQALLQIRASQKNTP